MDVVVVVVDIAVVLFQRGVNFLWIDLRFKTLTNIVLNSKIERVFLHCQDWNSERPVRKMKERSLRHNLVLLSIFQMAAKNVGFLLVEENQHTF